MLVTRAISWILAAALVAVISHIAYVLFLPQVEMNRLMSESVDAAGMNRFTVLAAGDQELILKESGRIGIAGVCPFDLADGTLVFDATLPDAIWSFAIYSQDGKDAYAINEAQAGTNRFRLTVKQSPGLLAMFMGSSDDTGGINDGWTATMPSRRGLAIVWVALDDRALRSAYAQVMKQTNCHIEANAGAVIEDQKSDG
jgi:uncharacterized membrane protein